METLNNLAKSNSSVNDAINLVNQNGGNGAMAFLKEARNRGMSDDQIAAFLNDAIKKFS